jgi:predicted transcriptional regulator
MRGANDRRREMRIRKHYPEPETLEDAKSELMRERTLREMYRDMIARLQDTVEQLADQLKQEQEEHKRELKRREKIHRHHYDEVRKSHGLGSCAGFYANSEGK